MGSHTEVVRAAVEWAKQGARSKWITEPSLQLWDAVHALSPEDFTEQCTHSGCANFGERRCADHPMATDGVTLWRHVLKPEPEDRFSGWGFFLLDSSGMLACVTDYGSYAYKWDAIGERDFRKFLCTCDQWYLTSKLDPSTHYDGDATLKRIRQRICELRREGQLTRDRARTEWELVELGDEVYSSVDFADWYRRTDLHDAAELAVYSSSPQIVAFCERLWPRFVALLKAQLEKDGIR